MMDAAVIIATVHEPTTRVRFKDKGEPEMEKRGRDFQSDIFSLKMFFQLRGCQYSPEGATSSGRDKDLPPAFLHSPATKH